MAIDFTDILISLTDLRQRIGGPSGNVNSQTYVSDTHLQNIIDLKKSTLEEIIERRMESLSAEQIVQLDVKFDEISVTVTAGTLVATGTIPDANLPVPFKAVTNAGKPLNLDNDIHSTANIYQGTGFTKYRYFIAGDDLQVLPNTSGNISVWLPSKDEVRQILVADVMDQTNQEIVNEARQMLQDRVAVANGFKVEAQNEAP